MIVLKTNKGNALNSPELEIKIKCIEKFEFTTSDKNSKEKEERFWADLIIDKLREQTTGGGWKVWDYEQIKIEYIAQEPTDGK